MKLLALDPRLSLLFNPSSVAIIGASSNAEKPSGATLANLIRAKYPGRLYPVNPRGGEIAGLRVYESVADLPEPPDLTIIIVPAGGVADALEAAGQRGSRVALVGVSGFAEAGPDGKARQDELVEIATRYEMRICGPNCNGVYNVLKGWPFGYNSSHGMSLPAGHAAIIAHSGAVLGSLAHKSRKVGLGLSYLAGIGNEADWDMCDYLHFCIEDESTTAIGLLMEGLKDGQRFLRLVGLARERNKQIVALKLGRSARGALVAQAHTARLAGATEVYDAAFRQAGVISVESIEAFLGTLQMLTQQPPVPNGRLMVMASTGAGAELVADRAAVHGVTLAEISEETRERFPKNRFSALLTNPWDTGGQARDPEYLSKACSVLANDPANDCLVLLLLELAARESFARCFSNVVDSTGKPGAVIAGELGEATLEIFRRHRIPVFETIDGCMGTFGAIFRSRQFPTDVSFKPTNSPNGSMAGAASQSLIENFIRREQTFLPEAEAKGLLARYGFRVARSITVRSVDEAQEAAERLGLPVILKGVTSSLTHKADAGLVSPMITSRELIEVEYRTIDQRLVEQMETSGAITVEQFVPHQFEAILGIKYDHVFGPVVLFGVGGIYTEVLNDVAIYLPGGSRAQVEHLLRSLRLFPVLERANAKGLVALDALVDSVLVLSRLAQDLGDRIDAFDVNPVALLPREQGSIVVLDAKAELRAS